MKRISGAAAPNIEGIKAINGGGVNMRIFWGLIPDFKRVDEAKPPEKEPKFRIRLSSIKRLYKYVLRYPRLR